MGERRSTEQPEGAGAESRDDDAPEAPDAPDAPDTPDSVGSRLRQGVRDMAWSLVVLLAIIAVLTWIVGSCQFSPGGPTVDSDSVPEVDASQELAAMAGQVDFALRDPDPPDAWQASSANTSTASADDTPSIARVSWITEEGSYLRLSQSPAPAEYVVADESDRSPSALRERGEDDTVEVAGQRWAVYPAYEHEDAWVTTLDGVQMMITGSGSAEEFRALAEATQRAESVR